MKHPEPLSSGEVSTIDAVGHRNSGNSFLGSTSAEHLCLQRERIPGFFLDEQEHEDWSFHADESP